jgi:hypothetical protein
MQSSHKAYVTQLTGMAISPYAVFKSRNMLLGKYLYSKNCRKNEENLGDIENSVTSMKLYSLLPYQIGHAAYSSPSATATLICVRNRSGAPMFWCSGISITLFEIGLRQLCVPT